jgi:hypothetical protein
MNTTEKRRIQMARIYFTAWSRSDVQIPAYAMACRRGLDTPAERVAAAIVRKNGCSGWVLNQDGCSVDGEIQRPQFELSFGRFNYAGLLDVTARVWFQIDG